MSMQLDSQRARLVLPTLFLFLAVLLALVASGSERERSVALAGGARSGDVCSAGGESDDRAIPGAAAAILGDRRVRLIYLRGVVEPVDRDFFGRPERMAIVSVDDDGFLIQNSVEDVSAGRDLKDHVGDDVTVRGTILVKTDGRATLLVDAFEVNRSRREGREE